jgi:hypothetical protein
MDLSLEYSQSVHCWEGTGISPGWGTGRILCSAHNCIGLGIDITGLQFEP